jgi:hypothetical protein
MIGARLVELIEIHSPRLTTDVVDDLITNERTRGFRTVRRAELEQRLSELLHHLGNWIGDPRSDRTRTEFMDWGRRRFDQGIPLSELISAIILIKQHLHRYISDNGLVDAAFPRFDSDYVLPMHLHSLQELNLQVGRFSTRPCIASRSVTKSACERRYRHRAESGHRSRRILPMRASRRHADSIPGEQSETGCDWRCRDSSRVAPIEPKAMRIPFRASDARPDVTVAHRP